MFCRESSTLKIHRQLTASSIAAALKYVRFLVPFTFIFDVSARFVTVSLATRRATNAHVNIGVTDWHGPGRISIGTYSVHERVRTKMRSTTNQR